MQLKWQISFLIYSFKCLSGNVSSPPSARPSHGWVWRASAIHMLLWLEPPFICWGKRWKHLPHKLAIWRLENSIPSSWFKHLGKAKLEHKDLEAFCPLMFITSRGLFRFRVALGAVQLENASKHVTICLPCCFSLYIWADVQPTSDVSVERLFVLRQKKGHFTLDQLLIFVQIRNKGLNWHNRLCFVRVWNIEPLSKHWPPKLCVYHQSMIL